MSASSRKPSANPHFNPVLYSIGKEIGRTLFTCLARWDIRGSANIPPRGTAVIFAANHRSLADPNLVGTNIPYPVHFFAKEELFRMPLVGWYIRRVNAFPVKRQENDVGAFKTAMRVLGNGEGLVLFPEGGRRLEPERQWKSKAGVGMLACLSGALVVPVGIKNAQGWNRGGPVRIAFGQPLHPPADADRLEYQSFSDRVMQRIKELCDEP